MKLVSCTKRHSVALVHFTFKLPNIHISLMLCHEQTQDQFFIPIEMFKAK